MSSTAFVRHPGFLLCFLILGTLPLYAQPCVPPDARASIVATDGPPPGQALWFGYAMNATCGIDSAICGEDLEPPPPPPAGVFYPRWSSSSCLKHPWFDYVAYRGPAAVDTHIVRWDSGPAIFHWNPDSIRAICDSALFIDQFGGILFKVRMDIDSGITLSQPPILAALIIRFGARPPLSASSQLDVLSGFRLEHNFPNPFNPSTTIRYQVERSGLVSVQVINILGAQVTSLAEGYRDAGTYSIQWDASELPGGVYFFRLITGDFTSTQKGLLLK